jgi:hypothetical protein
MEKQPVTDAKKQLVIARNAKIKQQMIDALQVYTEDEQRALERVQNLSEEEK